MNTEPAVNKLTTENVINYYDKLLADHPAVAVQGESLKELLRFLRGNHQNVMALRDQKKTLLEKVREFAIALVSRPASGSEGTKLICGNCNQEATEERAIVCPQDKCAWRYALANKMQPQDID